MKTKILTLLLLLLLNICSNAQIIEHDSIDRQNANAYVKAVDDFIRRFNGKAALPGINLDQKSGKEKHLLSLFDYQIFGTRDHNDKRYCEAKELISDILKYKIKLDSKDTSWIAIVPCVGNLKIISTNKKGLTTTKNKQIKFTLFLKMEYCGEEMYKWVIARAYGDDFKLTPSLTDSNIKLAPTIHELYFNKLCDLNNNKDLVLNYCQKQYEHNETTVFFAYIYSGLLTINYIDDALSFQFFQVPGWQFTIKEFLRSNSQNAGWLISDFQKMNDEDKKTSLHYYSNTTVPNKPIIIHDTIKVPIYENTIISKEYSIGNIGNFKMIYIHDFTIEGQDAYNYYIGETDVTQELWSEVMNQPNGDNFEEESKTEQAKKQFLKKLNKKTGKFFTWATPNEYNHATGKHYVKTGDITLRLVLAERK